jgi:polysaccharide biosynthesis protein PslH
MPRRSRAIVLSPEAPWPVIGGGALRTASIIEYLRPRYETTVVTFREAGSSDPRIAFPPDVRSHVIELPRHSKRWLARAVRNGERWARGIAPLVDRFSGFERQVRAACEREHFDVGIIEHFWCARYASELRPLCDKLVLNVHNVESVLLRRQAQLLAAPGGLMFDRFASSSAALEKETVPFFDVVLVTSEADRNTLGTGVIYPNAIPEVAEPKQDKKQELAFSGNLEYEPNYTAVRWFIRHVWPELRPRRADLTFRLIGRNEHAVSSLVNGDNRIVLSGPVDDAVTELARAQLSVVPVRAGSGTRVKIIEAWAAGLPVISTTIGAEGLPGRHGEHLLIADTPAAFLAAIERVLDSPDLQRSLGTAGRRLYEKQLTWTAAWEVLRQLQL